MSKLKMIGSASALFKILGEIAPPKDQDPKEAREQSIDQRARFYKLHDGLHFPENWDKLSYDEKSTRLDALDAIALERDGELS